MRPIRDRRLLTPTHHWPGKALATTRRSPSTGRSRRFCRASPESCSPWPPARARPSWPSRSAGSSGAPAGTAGSRAAPHPLPGRPHILVDDPKDKQFAPFGDARWKIRGEAIKSREMYFATYQAIAKDERRPGLYRDYARILRPDHCRRVPSRQRRDESNWREILEYFQPAYQFGMTATPLREDNRDTYAYFGDPSTPTACGRASTTASLRPTASIASSPMWTPPAGGRRRDELDRYGRAIPDGEYQTPDFERLVASRLARRPSQGASRISEEHRPLRQDHRLLRRPGARRRDAPGHQQPDCRPGAEAPGLRLPRDADEGDIGRGHLSRFQELETKHPG